MCNFTELSHAQIEVDVTYCALDLIPEEKSIPPLRILSFDIEVMTKPPSFTFPRDGLEPVIQIGNTLDTCGGVESDGELPIH